MENCRLFLTFALAFLSFNGFQAQECGRAAFRPRIVGGSEASPGSWPWIVSLSYADNDPYCGATLISELWVLTAAHCMDPPGYENLTTIHIGRHTVSDLNDTVSRDIDLMLCHPDYNITEGNDICLLKLSAPVVFTNYIQPICLAAKGSSFPSRFPSWVAGWGNLHESGEGHRETLQEVKLPIVGINECRCLNEYFVPEKTICAGYSEGGRDSCQGDSGGPLVVMMKTVWVQFGVVSFGEGCARPDRPGVYTLVSGFQDWIEDMIGDSSPPGFVLFDPPDTDSDVDYVCETKHELHDLYYTAMVDSGVRLDSTLLSLRVVVVMTFVGIRLL